MVQEFLRESLGGGEVVYKRTCQSTQRNYDKQNSLSSLFAWILLNIYSPIEPCNESPLPLLRKKRTVKHIRILYIKRVPPVNDPEHQICPPTKNLVANFLEN